MTAFTESVVEQTALAWLESADRRVLHGVEIASNEPAAARWTIRSTPDVLVERAVGNAVVTYYAPIQ